jgi:hypothetical protein
MNGVLPQALDSCTWSTGRNRRSWPRAAGLTCHAARNPEPGLVRLNVRKI